MGGGVGRQHRRLFERARANRPSIVFIDEIDAIAGRRGGLGAHDDPVNQLLAEIDGVAGQAGVFVIGATNRPDQLDSALLRGGRLSRTLYLGLPDERGRLAMLRLHTARMPTVRVRLRDIARMTEGFSPADLKALCEEAALGPWPARLQPAAEQAATNAPRPSSTPTSRRRWSGSAPGPVWAPRLGRSVAAARGGHRLRTRLTWALEVGTASIR